MSGPTSTGRSPALHVLVTRPQPDAEATALALREMGLRATIASMLTVEPTPAPPVEARVDDVRAVVLTSANAARALIQRPLGAHLMERELPVFAVGEGTARAARDIGFGHVINGDGDVDRLVEAVQALLPPGNGAVLYPCGAHTARDLVSALAAVDLTCRPVRVYDSHPAETLSRDVEDGLRRRRYNIVMLFSARTAGVFAELVETYGLASNLTDTYALCISAAVAGRAQALRWRDILVADRANHAGMLASVRQLMLARENGQDAATGTT